jgi:DMSO/TMAO reductase YedYZ molybdopterin-dependent catalytic subunit
MKRYNTINIIVVLGFLGLAAIILSSCSEAERTQAGIGTNGETPGYTGSGGAYPLVEGLHVTGTPVDIDIETYRLKISGAVDTPLNLSLEEIRAMESRREFITLVCPGFFTDEGTWTGVRIADLLDLAGVRDGADQLRFVAADGNYSATLKLEEVMGEGMLIAYAFQDKPLPKVHGYPLRLVAKDQPGNRWVKWLGQIVVQ